MDVDPHVLRCELAHALQESDIRRLRSVVFPRINAWPVTVAVCGTLAPAIALLQKPVLGTHNVGTGFRNMANRPTDGRENRSEPEIIPPDRARGEPLRGKAHIWVSIEQGGAHRAYIRQPGFFTVILLLLLFGVLMAAVLAVFLGTFLILVPAAIIIVFAFIVAGMVRAYFNRLWSSRTAGGGRDDSDARR